VLEKAPLFLLSAGASLLAFAAQIRSQTVASLDDLGLQARVANALLSYLAYLGHTLWPRGLAVFYPYAAARLGLVALLANAALLAGITAAVLAQRRRPYLACGWLWYLGTLVPVIGLVQAGLQARADRYTYVPLVGIFILVAWGGRELFARLRARPAAAAACATLVVLALAAQARVQVGYWQDNLSLFRHNLEVAPDDAMSLKNLGIALAARGQAAEANRLLARAYELDPRLRSRSHYNLGRTLAGSGNYADAVRYLREAVRISPGFGEARGLLDRILRDHPEAAGAGAGAPGDAHGSIQSPLTRGEALARSGRYEDAAAAFREAIRLEPELAGAHNNLGCALAALGRFEEAGAAFREAVRLRPDYAEARRNLARCLAERRP
jgi:tetratricopeptide (TPR) repeat protein